MSEKRHKFDAVVFDLDGVITNTAKVHASAWKEMFDAYLKEREQKYKEPFREFTNDDYLNYVDGKPRYEGVKSFLESRGIDLPYGQASDSPETESICGIGNRKNLAFNEIIETKGVEVFPSTVKLIHRLKKEGIAVGVASSSKNCEAVLKAAGLLSLVETRVDGVVSAELGLKGKPAPDIFTTAADNLGVSYFRTVVVEDAISGVQAGRNGNFGLVLGIARHGNKRELLAAGADIVVDDIEDICFEGIADWFENQQEEDSWQLSYFDYDKEKELSREALLSVGNGNFGTRGAMEEASFTKFNYPGTYMAGVYNRLVSKVAGREVENEDFVNGVNWLPVNFKINGDDWVNINEVKILDIARKLNFKTGVLEKTMTIEDARGRRTRIYSYRFASMANPELAGLSYSVQPLNYSATITLRSSLRVNHLNSGVKRYSDLNQKHLSPVLEFSFKNLQHVVAKTTRSKIYLSATARLEALTDQAPVKADFEHEYFCGIVNSRINKKLEKGQRLTIRKTVLLKKEKRETPKRHIKGFFDGISSFDEELEMSGKEWEKIWQKADIKIDGDRQAQKLIRLHIYHLMSCTSPLNVNFDAGIPARGLTGEAYRGHIFWDELYILPFYFIHFPEVAKSVLMYRYRRLEEAKKYARQNGYRGAMFPWQSGSSGREETQLFHYNPVSGKWGDDRSSLQRHISLAVAYNIIRYFQITGDAEFMRDYGMEMLLEIGLFWESKCKKDAVSGRYSIDMVMGPDEFHEGYPDAQEGGLQDNAYTNIMTAWLFKKVAELIKELGDNNTEAAFKRTGIWKEKVEDWLKISSNINLEISGEGIIAQHKGYFELKELDWDFYMKKYGDIHRMDRLLKAEGESPDDYKVAKQADLLMTFYNISQKEVSEILKENRYAVPDDYLQRNFEYYLKRTSHGSTLSRVVHSYLALHIGDYDLGRKMFEEALVSDYIDIQGGTTAEGIHTGVMAGTVMLIISAFAGVDFGEKHLAVNPKIPDAWESVSFGFTYRGVDVFLKIHHDKIEIKTSQAMELMLRGRLIESSENTLSVFAL